MFVQVFVLEVFLQRLRPARLPAPNRPLEGWAGMYKTAVCRELFLLQKVPQSARENSLADFPFKRRFQRQSISHAAARDQRLCLWKPQPFEKGWRKLYFCSAQTRCREVETKAPTKPIRELGAGSARRRGLGPDSAWVPRGRGQDSHQTNTRIGCRLSLPILLRRIS